MIAEDTDFKCEDEGEEVAKNKQTKNVHACYDCNILATQFSGLSYQTLEIMIGNGAIEARAGELQIAFEVERSAEGTRNNDAKGEES